ncbi:MAG: hypothetical protein ABI221_01950 [Candidatus Saccharimonadales bacterium]
MKRQQQPITNPQAKLRRLRPTITIYLFATSLIILLFIGIAANAAVNNHYRNDPGTQAVMATVKSTKQDCTKSGCYYDSYGNYSVYGIPQTNIKVSWLDKQPVSGQVLVLVNPKRPSKPMPYDYNPYPEEIVASLAVAAVVLAWNSFMYFVLYRRTKKKLLAQINTSVPPQRT